MNPIMLIEADQSQRDGQLYKCQFQPLEHFRNRKYNS